MANRFRDLLVSSLGALRARLAQLAPGPSGERVAALIDLGRIQRALGEEEAEEVLEEALSAAVTLRQPLLERVARTELGAWLVSQGEVDAGRGHLARAVEQIGEGRDARAALDLATAAAELALAHGRAGDAAGAQGALALARSALPAAPGGRARLELRAADLAALQGDATEANAGYQRALEAASVASLGALERATVTLGAGEGLARVPPAQVTPRELEALASSDLAALFGAALALARTPAAERATRAAELALALTGVAGSQVTQGGRALAAVGVAREGGLEVRQGDLALRLVPAPGPAPGERERLIARALLAAIAGDLVGGEAGTGPRVLAVFEAVLEAGLDLDRLVAVATRLAVEATGAARGLVLARELADPFGDRALRPIGPGAPGSPSIASRTLVREALLSGRPILLADAASDARFGGVESVREHGLRSVLVAPIPGADGCPLGLLYLDDPGTAGRFGGPERALAIELARRLGPTLAAALEAARPPAAGSSSAGARAPFDELVGRGPATAALVRLLERVVEAKAPVLVSGESGTGKELVARAIHRHGARAAAPFVAVSCATLADNVLESELFGHVRGAFTGADADHPGLFARAHGGVLFLDEIQDASPRLQAELLRVLETGEVRPVGSADVRRVDVRTVAATNADLRELLLAGRFREDLYYRLGVLHVPVPPLRDRREDVPELVRHFLERMGEGRRRVEPEALERLVRDDWPANVRGLRNCLERAVVLAGAGPIRAAHVVLEPARRAPARPLPAVVELTERQLALIERLRTEGHTGNAEHSARTGVAQQTGWRDLTDLVAKGVLVRTGRGKSTAYRLAPGWEARVWPR